MEHARARLAHLDPQVLVEVREAMTDGALAVAGESTLALEP